MIRAVSLFVVLLVTWLLLSGMFDPLLISLGILSCAFAAYVAWQMDLADHEGHPIHLGWSAITYTPWLIWEIVKSNIDVARIIVDPRLPIDPKVFTVTTSQRNELGQVIYANSITLTPGTVSLRVYEDKIDVHALTAAAADGLATGDMDRRVTRLDERHVEKIR